MRTEEPETSRHANFKALGIALGREQALSSPLRGEFFDVADFVVAEDPAVNSYLYGCAGRTCKHDALN